MSHTLIFFYIPGLKMVQRKAKRISTVTKKGQYSMNKALKMNLQYFSDEGGNGGSLYQEPPVNPLYVNDDPVVPDVSDVPDVPTIEELDFGGRRVPVVDPIIKDLHRDYQQQNQYITQNNQRMQQMEQQLRHYSQLMEFQQQQQQFQQPQAPQVDIEQLKEQYMDQFYDNPIEAQKWLFQQPMIQDVIRQQVETYTRPYIEPIQQERFWNGEIQRVQHKYQDFNDLSPAIDQVLQQNPDILNQQNGLEYAYLIAKGQSALSQPSPEQMMADPNYRKTLAQNPQLQQEVINSYYQQKQQTQAQTPPVMGRGTGSAPVVPGDKPKTIREGSRAYLKSLGYYSNS